MGGVRFEHFLDDVKEILGVSAGGKTVEDKLYFIPSEFQFLIVVVEFGVVEGDQLNDDQSDSEEIGFVLIEMGFNFQILDIFELLGGEEIFRQFLFLAQDGVVATVAVVGVHIEEVQFDMSFGAKEYLLTPVCAFADIIPFEFVCETYQGFSDIEEITLGEMVFGYFLLFNGLLEGEIVVVDVAVEHLMFNAELCIWG